MVAEAGGNMACMEDQVVYCDCVKELGLSGTVAGFFERELFPPSLYLSLALDLFLLLLYKWLAALLGPRWR